jgi:hypothetical protein
LLLFRLLQLILRNSTRAQLLEVHLGYQVKIRQEVLQ